MTAKKVDLLIEQGGTFSRVFEWKDNSGDSVDNPGYSARMQIRETVDSTSVLLELTTANGRISLGGASGTVTLTIAAADTEDITGWTRGVYDLELVSGTTVIPFIYGDVCVRKEVTRDD